MVLCICQFRSPNSSQPLHATYVCYLGLCLYFCFASRFISTLFIDPTYMHYYKIFLFSFWLRSVWQSLAPSMSLQMTQFHFFYGYYIYIYIYIYICAPHLLHPFFCWWKLSLLSCPGYCSAAVNIGMHISFEIMVFFGYMPRSGIAGSYSVLFSVFWGTSILFSIMVVSVYIPTNSLEGFPFLHTLSSIYCL